MEKFAKSFDKESTRNSRRNKMIARAAVALFGLAIAATIIFVLYAHQGMAMEVATPTDLPYATPTDAPYATPTDLEPAAVETTTAATTTEQPSEIVIPPPQPTTTGEIMEWQSYGRAMGILPAMAPLGSTSNLLNCVNGSVIITDSNGNPATSYNYGSSYIFYIIFPNLW